MLTKQVVLHVYRNWTLPVWSPKYSLSRRNKIGPINGRITSSQKENTRKVHLLFDASMQTNSDKTKEWYHIHFRKKSYWDCTVRRHMLFHHNWVRYRPSYMWRNSQLELVRKEKTCLCKESHREYYILRVAEIERKQMVYQQN